MKENLLLIKAKEFAIEILNLCKNIKSPITNQISRSGTSIGANVHEANYAHSKADFIAKLEIALKECYETEYWLELLKETNCMSDELYKTFQQNCGQIRRLLIVSCTTAKKKQ